MKRRDEKRLMEHIARKGGRPYEHKPQTSPSKRSSRAERRPISETREAIETIPGEDDFDPW
jgi:hypothetical protein